MGEGGVKNPENLTMSFMDGPLKEAIVFSQSKKCREISY